MESLPSERFLPCLTNIKRIFQREFQDEDEGTHLGFSKIDSILSQAEVEAVFHL